jgi:N-acetylmuramoyl-L-alanine amidase
VTGLTVHQAALPYAGQLDIRETDSIDLAVIHCTELPDLAMAREFGMQIHYPDSGTGHCGHFYIDRNGRVEQWAPLDRTAHHVRGFNLRSLGIELVNLGRYPNWLDSSAQTMTEPYPEDQVDKLIQLLEFLCTANSQLQWITGHEKLDREKVPATDDSRLLVRRKSDPGPLFPWETVLRSTPLKPFI